MRYAYNTNGLTSHRLSDALPFLADTGYAGVALTLDVVHLDPFAPDAFAQAEKTRAQCDELGLGVVVETGARYLLDPRAKHEPTLITPDAEGRARRIDFLVRAAAVGADLGAEAVSFWAGVPRPGVGRTQAAQWLAENGHATVTELTPEQIAVWQEATRPAVEQFRQEAGEAGDQLLTALDALR